MKKVFKKSTKVLILGMTALGSLVTWAMDPQNLAALEQLAHGHARILGYLGTAAAIYSVLHEPKKQVSAKK